ncbi:Histone-lysine N-methyltransferase SETMAR [Eumeta japonica]|uniref:Histone-lysine N-methyltransferase SETMAR n=1 Tax=Eumeta variegata TaxID=151549 RepID=A0A4C1TFB5_EUMVA|nr:Histone-lysine N-methyltransferase SETMAR [Eumeta japonica]
MFRATGPPFRDADFEILEHPPYSSELAPSDLLLFPRFKEYLKGQRFDDDEAVVVAVQEFLESRTRTRSGSWLMTSSIDVKDDRICFMCTRPESRGQNLQSSTGLPKTMSFGPTAVGQSRVCIDIRFAFPQMSILNSSARESVGFLPPAARVSPRALRSHRSRLRSRELCRMSFCLFCNQRNSRAPPSYELGFEGILLVDFFSWTFS